MRAPRSVRSPRRARAGAPRARCGPGATRRPSRRACRPHRYEPGGLRSPGAGRGTCKARIRAVVLELSGRVQTADGACAVGARARAARRSWIRRLAMGRAVLGRSSPAGARRSAATGRYGCQPVCGGYGSGEARSRRCDARSPPERCVALVGCGVRPSRPYLQRTVGAAPRRCPGVSNRQVRPPASRARLSRCARRAGLARSSIVLRGRGLDAWPCGGPRVSLVVRSRGVVRPRVLLKLSWASPVVIGPKGRSSPRTAIARSHRWACHRSARRGLTSVVQIDARSAPRSTPRSGRTSGDGGR